MMMKDLKLTKRRKLLAAVIICVILITCSTMLWQMGQVAEAAILNPHPGLVGWWRFDEGSGTIAEDSSGHGNHGTIYGATSVDGKYGKALSFDGTDDYVELTDDPLDLTQEHTLMAWINLTDTTEEAILSKMAHDVQDWTFHFSIKNGKIRYHLYEASAQDYLNGNTALQTGQWYHVAVTYKDTGSAVEVRAYLNGVADGSDLNFDTSARSTSVPVWIGRYTYQQITNWMMFSGTLDEVRIYNRALSEAEIQESFQKDPDFSSRLLAKVPKGTTQFITTLSWQGVGSIDATIESLSETYTEDMVSVYQKTIYSSSSGDMLNIKRLAVSVTALPNDENWYITLEFDDVEDYKITVEVQR